jgi:hypothetical protein
VPTDESTKVWWKNQYSINNQGDNMAVYSVLITTMETRSIEATSAREARDIASEMYKVGDIELDAVPYFECEECDIQEDV